MYYKIKELCIKLVVYQSCTKMHSQQNIETKICEGVQIFVVPNIVNLDIELRKVVSLDHPGLECPRYEFGRTHTT